MKLKSFTIWALSGIMAGSFACLSPAMAEDMLDNGDSDNAMQPMQLADNSAQGAQANIGAATESNDTSANINTASNDSSNNINTASTDDGSPDTATGDDDY